MGVGESPDVLFPVCFLNWGMKQILGVHIVSYLSLTKKKKKNICIEYVIKLI